MSPPFGRRIVADATAETTFSNLQLASDASGPDGLVYLELINGQAVQGRLEGATTTHLVLSGSRIAVADIQTYIDEGDTYGSQGHCR